MHLTPLRLLAASLVGAAALALGAAATPASALVPDAGPVLVQQDVEQEVEQE